PGARARLAADLATACYEVALRALGEPTLRLRVQEDDRVFATREHDVEVATVDRLLRPPAVDHAPFLAHERDLLPVHAPRRAIEMGLDERGRRRIQSSRGTSSARCSGIRDQGATSTTEQTAPEPAPARTCRRPSVRCMRSS